MPLESPITFDKSLFIVAVCYKFVLHIEVFCIYQTLRELFAQISSFRCRYKITQLSQYYVTFSLLLFLLLYEALIKMYGDAYASVEMDDENERAHGNNPQKSHVGLSCHRDDHHNSQSLLYGSQFKFLF